MRKRSFNDTYSNRSVLTNRLPPPKHQMVHRTLSSSVVMLFHRWIHLPHVEPLSWDIPYFAVIFVVAMTISGKTPSVGIPILGHGREVPRWWPPFWGFSIWLGPSIIPPHTLIDPLFLQKKIRLSLSYLDSEILASKVGLIFH